MSVFNSESPTESIEKIFRFLSKGLVVYIVYSVIETERDIYKCIKSITLFIFLLCIIVTALICHTGSITVLRGVHKWQEHSYLWPFYYTIVSNPNLISRSVIITTPFIYASSFLYHSRIIRTCIKILCLTSIAICLIGISRTAIIVMILILLAMFIKYRDKSTVVLVLSFIVLLFIFWTLPQFKGRYEEAFEEKGSSIYARLRTINTSLEYIKKHPVIGYGRGFRLIRGEIEGTNDERSGKEKYYHNLPIQILVENGIVGLITFFIMIYSYLSFLIKQIKKDRLYLDSGVLIFPVAIGICGFFLTTLTGGMIEENIFWYVIGLSFAIVKIRGQRHLTMDN